MSIRDAPPKPIPSPDPRVLAGAIGEALRDDPEEALTAHLTPLPFPPKWVMDARRRRARKLRR